MVVDPWALLGVALAVGEDGRQREPDTKPHRLLIDFRDVVCSEDPWEHKEYMARVGVGRLVTHPAVKLTLCVLIVINEVLIASQTPTTLPWGFQFWLSYITDSVVLVALVTEVLLNWLRDGWNTFNFFLMVCLMVGPLIPKLNVQKIFQIPRLMRLLQVRRLVEGLARVLQAILKVIPDLCNIRFILFISMLIFSALGIILFGKAVPAHFGDVGKAPYSFFTCITLDGWLDIYEAFQEEGQTLKMMAAIYFIIFVTSEAFICDNLLVAMLDGGEANTDPQLSPKVMGDRVSMYISQGLFTYSRLGTLSEEISHEVQRLLESSKESIREYKQIREELNVVVEEVRAIEFNVAQEHELIQREFLYTAFLDSPYPSEVTLMMCGDIISTLSKLEEKDLVHPKNTWWVADGRDWGQWVVGWVSCCE
ncbi:cation channel sperm-associated protein 4-like [Gymnogyps californianus]|uniref:cation channel sperm-associated protein 4-like n=1 Tax=Gymnogyps californianus TaxID=33616 RepID=UPI0021CAB375|nr:cation channel sperm-associated protein 4-like [Gymnogyps californianus]